MRKIHYRKIYQVVKNLCIAINYNLPSDVVGALTGALKKEKNRIARYTLCRIIENTRIARDEKIPLCQDTGTVEVFAEVGCDAAIIGGCFTDAVNEGVAAAYTEEKFRASVVSDPLARTNTRNNTPATVNVEFVEGNDIKIQILLKGAGSENSSVIKFFPPSVSYKELEDFIFGAVVEKAAYSCPPVVVSAAIGGNFSSAPLASKKALFRKIGSRNPDCFYEKKEMDLLKRINSTGIGPMGTGGKITALAVFLTPLSSHIASMPCAVNIQCHSFRRGEIII